MVGNREQNVVTRRRHFHGRRTDEATNASGRVGSRLSSNLKEEKLRECLSSAEFAFPDLRRNSRDRRGACSYGRRRRNVSATSSDQSLRAIPGVGQRQTFIQRAGRTGRWWRRRRLHHYEGWRSRCRDTREWRRQRCSESHEQGNGASLGGYRWKWRWAAGAEKRWSGSDPTKRRLWSQTNQCTGSAVSAVGR